MATGTLPFSGESTGLIFEAILNRSPRPASSVVSGIPGELDRIIQKALERIASFAISMLRICEVI